MTEQLINDVADLLGKYDAKVAAKFRSEPFHRKLIAKAFLRGCKPDSAAADIGFKAFRVADLDERARALAV
ncbi:MAG: hypothetical protein AAGD43_16355 [Pseudomonadota bacterium]